MSVPQPRTDSPSRHLWLVAAFALCACAVAGGYSLALHEIEAPYVGLLGPRSRYEKLRRALDEKGGTPDRAGLARVRSPVGLALGAETPEEIAVSILGEILALQRGFDGGFLAGREASLHRPDDRSALARS